jgi:PAS domain S-box-containing protein
MSNSHEWCAENVVPEINNLQNLSCDLFPWWMAELRNNNIINVPSVAELPEYASAEKEILSLQGIQSVLVFPVTIKGKLSGFIGLDDVSGAAKWSNADISVLRTAVEIISSALERFESEIILERRNAELIESEEYQRKLLSSLLTGIMTVDADTHHIVDINEYGCQLFGAKKEEIVGHLCHNYICPAEEGKCPATDLQQQIQSAERKLIKANGTQLSVIKSVFRIKRGNQQYLIESLTDVEPLKKAQAALSESEQQYKKLYEQEKVERAELEKESQARANFISVLTHELKTPLTPLLASMELLSDQFGNDQQSVEGRLVHNAMIGAASINNRLNELLDLAKMTSGTYKFDRQPVEAGDFFKVVTNHFVPEFLTKNQLLVTDVEPALPLVKLDSARLQRAIAYLLDSASKSSEKGDPVILRARVDNHQLLINIEHRGEIISEDEKQRLFEPYHRVEQDRQRFSGLGLGFAITKQIIDAHGGWIQLKSDLENGNKFIIGIPLDDKPPPG